MTESSKPLGTYGLIACDLDDTLTVSKQPIDMQIAQTISDLLEYVDFCIITGGMFTQINEHVLERLPMMTDAKKGRLLCMSTSGARFHIYKDNDWQLVYEKTMTYHERRKVKEILQESAQKLDMWEDNPKGEIIEDRHTQVTYSALGQNASPDEKRKWDPDAVKRGRLHEIVSAQLPDYEVAINGTTSINVTMPGIDKAYGMNQLMTHTGYSKDDIVFFGDSLFEGGNDWPVHSLGIRSIAVKNWHETNRHLKAILDMHRKDLA